MADIVVPLLNLKRIGYWDGEDFRAVVATDTCLSTVEPPKSRQSRLSRQVTNDKCIHVICILTLFKRCELAKLHLNP